MNAAIKSAKAYVDYLDKEMTIMGILSVFCISAAAVVAKTIAGIHVDPSNATVAEILWVNGGPYLMAGNICLLVAALLFYLQRSLLAYHYGRLCLAEVKGEDCAELLDDADSWATWLRYRWGFIFTTLGFAYLLIPFLHLLGLVNARSLKSMIVVAVIALIYMVPQSIVLLLYESEESPWRAVFNKKP